MKILVVFLGLAMLCSGGCNTLADAREGKGTGTWREYPCTFDQVWDATPKAAQRLDLVPAGAYRDEKYMLFERGARLGSWGERVAVFYEPVSPTRTIVEVVSKKAMSVQITAKDYEDSFLEEIAKIVALRP